MKPRFGLVRYLLKQWKGIKGKFFIFVSNYFINDIFFIVFSLEINPYPEKKNVFWKHDYTNSCIRKVETSLAGVYDILILPPILIKNALPASVRLKMVIKQFNSQ